MYKMLATYITTLFGGFVLGVYTYYLIGIPLFVSPPSVVEILRVGTVVLFILLASVFIAIRTHQMYRGRSK